MCPFTQASMNLCIIKSHYISVEYFLKNCGNFGYNRIYSLKNCQILIFTHPMFTQSIDAIPDACTSANTWTEYVTPISYEDK